MPVLKEPALVFIFCALIVAIPLSVIFFDRSDEAPIIVQGTTGSVTWEYKSLDTVMNEFQSWKKVCYRSNTVPRMLQLDFASHVARVECNLPYKSSENM